MLYRGRKIAPGVLWVSLTEAAANVSPQRIFAGFAADIEICTIRICKAGTFESFAHTPLVVINRREIRDGRNVIHENLKRFAVPLHAAVEL